MPDRKPESKPRLVSSGTFRIDRNAAFEKLRLYQLPEPWLFVQAWARAAALSKPDRIELDRFDRGGGVRVSQLRFFGTPLPPDFVERPFDWLFAGEGSEAARQVVAGVLAASRLNPPEIEVLSGSHRWTLSSGGTEQVQKTSGAKRLTELRVRWKPERTTASPTRFTDAFTRACGMIPFSVYIGGKSWARDRHPFLEGESRQLIVERTPGEPEGLLILYRNGVRAGELVWPGFERLRAQLNDDGFRLDASGCEVVRDGYFHKSVERAAKEAARLFEKRAAHKGTAGWLGSLRRRITGG